MNRKSEFFRQNAFYGRSDFLHLANMYGINLERAERMVDQFPSKKHAVLDLIRCSFLDETAKTDYCTRLRDRLKAIGCCPKTSNHSRR